MPQTAEFLRKLGISPSPQRVAIYKFIMANPIHPTVDTIFQAVQPQLPTISRTTVYNTVKRLASLGALQEVIIEDGELRYDADISTHGHFKCMKCGAVHDLFPPSGTPLLEKIHGLPEGFQVDRIHLCCRGICNACKK